MRFKTTDKRVEILSKSELTTNFTDVNLPECDCGNGVPGEYDFSNCYGNTFYLGIYGAIGVSVGIFSFTKENGFSQLSSELEIFIQVVLTKALVLRFFMSS